MSVIFAMCLYSFSMSITPGPVNLITLTTGINHGFKNALPFVSGASIGFALLLYCIGLGFNQMFNEYSFLMEIFGICGSVFICYIGYKIAISTPDIQISKTEYPTFLHGFVLQWLNPKAWIASIAGIAAFNLADSSNQLIMFVSIYFAICYLSISTWAFMGTKISALLYKPKHLRIFNIMMGLSLIGVSFYLMFSQI